ncbi:PWWP domain-containing protein2 [Neolecta irregularis DAH-3]|uniref:PWWP domain-containing protein2 n=1 Tax=Neolecta irregularis (strain DAH-3) TaxID=1198029 RepID=A0A1U7LHJ1_NEOID|nr:PWWP domain-containing protein2 [Neolecta irregularis DAH-3]|eukprot:OLL22125.1 PWWP domain-containing protein2 [Neolecta irregularis DAH-3]
MFDSPSAPLRALTPGTLVLGKIKGYPWWPGIACFLVTDEQVTEEAIKLKPANKSEIYAVYFFPDANYLWASKSEVKPLRPEEIDNFLKLGKGSKDLKDAYKMATKPPTLQQITDFVKNGFSAAAGNAESDHEEIEEEEDIDMHESNDDGEAVPPEDEEEPVAKPKKKTPVSKKRKKSESVDGDEDEEPKKKPRKTPAKRTPSKTPAKKATNGKSKVTQKSAQKDRRKITNSDEEVEPVEKVLPSPDKIEKDVLFVRHKLQKALLSAGAEIKPEDMLNVKSQLEKLSKFDGLTSPILKATKIGKVLKRIVNLVEIPRDEELKIKEGAQNILDQWRKLADSGSPEKPEANGANGKAPPPHWSKIEAGDQTHSNNEAEKSVAKEEESYILETGYASATETKETPPKDRVAASSSETRQTGEIKPDDAQYKCQREEATASLSQEFPSAAEKGVDSEPTYL